ncbi:MAG: glycosyltransferase [Nitrosomonas sp.]|nr:MAG: glycosyltransferase [Nitrosomonas sp.]
MFNHEKYIDEAIRSVLNQSVKDLELIVIDDGSTDQSQQIVKNFTDPRIRYYFQSNSGAAFTINRGISMAAGLYVAILNSDDTFHPERLAEALAVLESEPSVGAFFSAYNYIDDASVITRESQDIIGTLNLPTFSVPASEHLINEESDNWVLTLLSGNVLHTTSNLIIRTKLFDRIGMFESWRYVHDYEFFLRLCSKQRIYFARRPLLNYRFHGTNTLAENAARSVYETNLVIAHFLASWHPKIILEQPDKYNRLLDFLFHHLNLYGGERFLLAQLIIQIISRNQKGLPSETLSNSLPEDSLFQIVAPGLKETVSYDQLHQSYQWQKNETEQWWKKCQELETGFLWQKDQTNYWWEEAQKSLQALTQQKEHSAWQKKQTDLWWQQTQDLKQQLINANHLLGIPNMLRNCKQRIRSFFLNKVNK